MMKLKVRLFRILCVAMLAIFSSSMLSGCLLLGIVELFGVSSGMDGLAGVKVLYKPAKGEYTDNSDALDALNQDETEKNSYFQFMAKTVLNNLFYAYFVPTYNKEERNDNHRESYLLWSGLLDSLNESPEFVSVYNGYVNKEDAEQVRQVQANFFERVRFETVATQIDHDGDEFSLGNNATPRINTVVENKNKKWNWSLPTKLTEFSSPFELEYNPPELNNVARVPAEASRYAGQLYFLNNPGYTFSKVQNLYDIEENGRYQKYYIDKYEDFKSSFVNTFSPALQINLYELALGRELTHFTVKYAEDELPFIEGISGRDGQDGADRVAAIKNDHDRLSSNVGLPAGAIAKLKTYVLDTVIGTTARQIPDNITSKNVFYDIGVDAAVDIAAKNVYIGGVVGDEVNKDGEIVGTGTVDITDVYPAAHVMDYPATSFFLSPDDGDPFKGIPAMEYHSFVLMPSREDEIMAVWLAFQYDAFHDGPDNYIQNLSLNIDVTARFYNAATRTVTIINGGSISVPDGPYEAMGRNHLLMFDFPDYVQLDPFDNTIGGGVLATGGSPKVIQGIRRPGELYIPLDFYTAIDSKNGFGSVGILKPELNFSYLEFTFDIEKDPYETEKYYDFQVGLTGYYQTF